MQRFIKPLSAALASLSLLGGCGTLKPIMTEADFTELKPDVQAQFVEAAAVCKVKPLAMLNAFGQRPMFDGVVQDVTTGAFSAVFVADPQAERQTRVLVSLDDLVRPARIEGLKARADKGGETCALAFADMMNTQRAVTGIVAAAVAEAWRELPERPLDAPHLIETRARQAL